MRLLIFRRAAAWKRRPWERDDSDPEQLAREAIAEIQGAIGELETVLELLTSPKPNYEGLPRGGGCPGPAGLGHEGQGRRLWSSAAGSAGILAGLFEVEGG